MCVAFLVDVGEGQSRRVGCVFAVNQASSIQHLDVCCESITVGHNNYMLPLSSNHLELRGEALVRVGTALCMGDGSKFAGSRRLRR